MPTIERMSTESPSGAYFFDQKPDRVIGMLPLTTYPHMRGLVRGLLTADNGVEYLAPHPEDDLHKVGAVYEAMYKCLMFRRQGGEVDRDQDDTPQVIDTDHERILQAYADLETARSLYVPQ